ncbi:MAG TPA: PqqD family protein [Abditibacterium sp.]|jgi:hypothetical protein
MKQTLTKNSTVVAITEQVSTDLAGKTAILNLKNGTYYSLDPVGSPLWTLLQEERRVGELCDAMVHKYKIEPAQCEKDLLTFLQQLWDQGLICVK